jgi:hypothetical protein
MTETFNPPITTYFPDVKLGDVLRLDFMKGTPFNVGVVKNIKDGVVSVYRSYIHTSDFAHTGGVTVYQGHEDIYFDRSDETTKISLLERRNPS